MSRKKQVYEKITALYCRISLDDGGDNESMSISNQCSFDFDHQLFHQFCFPSSSDGQSWL